MIRVTSEELAKLADGTPVMLMDAVHRKLIDHCRIHDGQVLKGDSQDYFIDIIDNKHVVAYISTIPPEEKERVVETFHQVMTIAKRLEARGSEYFEQMKRNSKQSLARAVIVELLTKGFLEPGYSIRYEWDEGEEVEWLDGKTGYPYCEGTFPVYKIRLNAHVIRDKEEKDNYIVRYEREHGNE